MAFKKSLMVSALWKECEALRGDMDASYYKDYVLVLLFVKYVTDKADRQQKVLLTVPTGCSFSDIVALKGTAKIGAKINKIIGKLAAANDLKGIINVADFTSEDKLGSGKEMVERLSSLVALFDKPELDFCGTNGDELIADAFSFLLHQFAAASGTSKDPFYTPAEVARVMAKVIGVGTARAASQTIHDPTCGTGSLLLTVQEEAKGRTGKDLALYGQERDNATAGLARMNMIIHGCPTAEIWQGNTLASPHFKDSRTDALKTFDFVVASVPFSAESSAFLLHSIACIRSTGKGAVILPHSVLSQEGAEAALRREIVPLGFITCIIGLPENLFYGADIPASILVLDKENAGERKGILMIDASAGFIKDGSKNRLRDQDIHRIVDTCDRMTEIPRFSRMVPLTEISDPTNDFNLTSARYINTAEHEDQHDSDASARGGIPIRAIDALAAYWKVVPGVRTALFKKTKRPGYCQLKPAAADIKNTIVAHADFIAFSASVSALFAQWKKANVTHMKSIALGEKPHELIEHLSEDLLATFSAAGSSALINAYDVYQHIMDYWAATMQDDVALLVQDGWKALEASGAAQECILSEAEIKTRVVDNKWLPAIGAAVQREIDRVAQTLTERICRLAERNATTLPSGMSNQEQKRGTDQGLVCA